MGFFPYVRTVSLVVLALLALCSAQGSSPGTGSQGGSFPPLTIPPVTTPSSPSTSPPHSTQAETTQPPHTTTVPPTTQQTTQPPTTYPSLPTLIKDVVTPRKGHIAIGVIVGIVLGSLALAGLIGGALYYRWRRQAQRPLLPWAHGQQPVMNDNPAYAGPAVGENPLHA